MTPRTVEVRKYKWPDRFVDRCEEVVIGRDAHGEWHGVAAGTPFTLADRRVARHSQPFVACFPPDRWWVAGFNPPVDQLVEFTGDGPAETLRIEAREVYVHIATPPEMREGALCFTDLELDVVRYADGRVAVLDEEDFERAGLPADVAASARAACDEVARMLRGRDEPFGEAGRAWLRRFMTAGL